jgi:hypothetical protein
MTWSSSSSRTPAEGAAAARLAFGTEEERKVRVLMTRERLVPTDEPV